MATKEETKQKFRELMMAVVKRAEEHPEIIPEPLVQEVHVCILCKGINREKTYYENKKAKTLRFNNFYTRYHYAECITSTEEGRVYFEKNYPIPGFEEGKALLECGNVQCQQKRRLKKVTKRRGLYNHMALYHGGLEAWLLSQEREDLQALVPKLLCHKLPGVCNGPDCN